jgi:DNA-binding IclR family transcriptional regulator
MSAGAGVAAGAKTIKVLENSAALLGLLAARGALSQAEIARLLGIPRPSVYRLVEAMEVIGFVSIDSDGAIRLGLELLHLAQSALSQTPELRRAQGFLTELREQTGQTVYFGVRRGAQIVCLDRRDGATVNLLVLSPGGTLPPHAGALSRAIVAFDDVFSKRAVSHQPFEPLTPHTLTTAEQLEADAELTRSRGFSLSDEDVTIGVAALGVPVFSATGQLAGALSVAGLRDEIITNSDEFYRLLDAAARGLGENLATT